MGTLSVDKLVKTSTGAAEFTLPATDGTAGQVMQTDGSGQLSVAALASDTVGTAQLSATGTADSTTFLRGDNSWGTIAAGLTWEAVQTSAFTAVAGKAYPVNTTAAAITVTLPASPSAGDEVLILDYAGTFDTNVLTLGNNGSNILGDTSTTRTLVVEYQATKLRYIDATLGWTSIATGIGANLANPEYVAATGPDGAAGAVDGDYKYHVFNTSKSGVNAFNVSSVGNSQGSNTVEYLIVAGGGGGGGQHGGGGGAGGYAAASGLTLTGGIGNYEVTIGGGGAKAAGPASSMPQGTSGSNSLFPVAMPGTVTATGGGGGGSYRNPAATPGVSDGLDGGSGGGGGSSDNGSGFSGMGGSATGTQGNDGGKGRYSGGGGGGAGAVGGQAEPATWGPTATSLAGAGGAGTASIISGSTVTRGGGGGGGTYANTSGAGAGGAGGGARGSDAGGNPGGTNATNATVNTGGGGGGSGVGGTTSGSNGGSGVVIVRYKFQN